MLYRELLARSDTEEQRNKISSAQELIYGQNYAVDSFQVKGLLKDESLVLTIVCILCIGIITPD